jgi:hypothetical protein
MELVELRAMHWRPSLSFSQYYVGRWERLQQQQQQQPVHYHDEQGEHWALINVVVRIPKTSDL